MADELHIVSFNVPWPADYGGVMDVYYRLKALAEAGLHIHLHCFTYGRPPAPQLEKLCASVSYYRRHMSPWLQFDRRPFIVASRDNADLLHRLQADRLPVLLEGVHTCSLLEPTHLGADRHIAVRAHNVEVDYYTSLASAEPRLFKKAYLRLEAYKLRAYEPMLTRAERVFTVSDADRDYFLSIGCPRVDTVVCGHPHSQVESGTWKVENSDSMLSMPYALFHGDLSVPENEQASVRLITLFSTLDCPLVLAGHAPSARLRNLAARYANVTLVPNPTDDQMSRLLAEAQLNILVTQQATGLKLKLLNALFSGRHCLVNSAMVAGTGLESLCTVADSDDELRQAIHRLMQQDFGEQQLERRRIQLEPYVTAHAVGPIVQWVRSVEIEN